MKTMQQRILGQIEQILTDRGYSLAVSFGYANIGTIHVFTNDEVKQPLASVNFAFNQDTYTLSLTVDGVRIPSQVGRADYFDFYQSYTEPTRFWGVLRANVPEVTQ